eukprot:scaffold138055_cov48-Prasinocladus_malaysianus.AAC.2
MRVVAGINYLVLVRECIAFVVIRRSSLLPREALSVSNSHDSNDRMARLAEKHDGAFLLVPSSANA